MFPRFPANRLSAEKGREDEFKLYTTVERLAPKIIADKRHIYKGVAPMVPDVVGVCDIFPDSGMWHMAVGKMVQRAYQDQEQVADGSGIHQYHP